VELRVRSVSVSASLPDVHAQSLAALRRSASSIRNGARRSVASLQSAP
jgi:hypothetical protein